MCRFAVLVTATTAVVLTIGGLLLDRQLDASLRALHEVEADEIGGLLGSNGAQDRQAVRNRIKHDADSDAALFVMQVSDRHGTVLFRSDNLADAILPAAEPGEEHRTAELPFLGDVYLSTFDRGPWRIQIGSPLQPSRRMLREYLRMSLPLLAATGLISMGLGYAFSRATLRPIRAIEATAKRIRADDLTERIPVASAKDELSGLSLLLNQMFDRLQNSFDDVRRFTADASHELKTPLSLIRLNAEKLRSRLSHDTEGAAAIGDILEEAERIQQVIDRLLFLAKADSGALKPKQQDIDIPAFVDAISADAAALAEDRGSRFEIRRNDPGHIRGDSDLLRQVVLNVITNAAAVSPPGGMITMDSIREDKRRTIVVTDEGPGMDPAEIGRAFERFVRFERNDDPQRRRQAGHGLGLAICKSIVELHHGTISAENRTDGSGLRVRISLPESPAETA